MEYLLPSAGGSTTSNDSPGPAAQRTVVGGRDEWWGGRKVSSEIGWVGNQEWRKRKGIYGSSPGFGTDNLCLLPGGPIPVKSSNPSSSHPDSVEKVAVSEVFTSALGAGLGWLCNADLGAGGGVQGVPSVSAGLDKVVCLWRQKSWVQSLLMRLTGKRKWLSPGPAPLKSNPEAQIKLHHRRN